MRGRRLAETEQAVSGFRALMECTSDAVKVIDLDGRVRAWNAGCETLYGYKAREVIGHVMPHLRPDDRSRAIADFRRIASLGIVEEREIVAVRKDGSRVAASTTASCPRISLCKLSGLKSCATRTTTPMKPIIKPPRRGSVIFSSCSQKFAMTMTNNGVAALRMEARPESILVSPHVINRNGMTVLKTPMKTNFMIVARSRGKG